MSLSTTWPSSGDVGKRRSGGDVVLVNVRTLSTYDSDVGGESNKGFRTQEELDKSSTINYPEQQTVNSQSSTQVKLSHEFFVE